jgi:death-on-curing protein
MVQYLTVTDVLDMHEYLVGPGFLRRRDLLESAIAVPQATMFGSDLYPGLYDKAAALMRSLSQNHAFQDGNKRIAWYAWRLFLQANGIKVRANPEEVVELFERLATHQIDVPEIAEFLMGRSGHN